MRDTWLEHRIRKDVGVHWRQNSSIESSQNIMHLTLVLWKCFCLKNTLTCDGEREKRNRKDVWANVMYCNVIANTKSTRELFRWKRVNFVLSSVSSSEEQRDGRVSKHIEPKVNWKKRKRKPFYDSILRGLC